MSDADSDAPTAPTSWRARASLATQLSFTIAFVLLLGLALSIALVVQQSRRAIEREIGSELRFASAALDSALADGADARTLRDLSRHLDSARHLCVVDARQPPELRCPTAPPAEVPAWFASLATPPRQTERKLLQEAGGQSWQVLLISDPADELAEAWTDARGLLGMLVAVTLLIQVIGYRLVTRGLAGVRTLRAALTRLQEGQWSTPVACHSARDLQTLASGIETLRRQLLARSDENHRLLQRCLETQEDERVQLARELHDDLGQSLTAIEVELAVARRALEPCTEAADAALDAAAVNARAAAQSLRHLLHGLRPGGLDHLGLALALQQLADDWQRRLPGLHLHCDIDDTLRVGDATTALHLYRLAQEALTNIARHAQASEALVRLRLDDGRLQLTIADNGRGIASTSHRRGLGIVGMRERAQALRASLRIESRPQCGCRIELSMQPAR